MQPNPEAGAVSAAKPANPVLVPPRPVIGLASNAPPAYPPLALRRREEGRVVVQVTVSVSGAALAVSVVQSSGHPSLDTAAAEKVRQWRFEPATRGGVPVQGVADAPITFRLPD